MIQILNGIALIIGVLWFIYQPDFEPALTSIALLATLIGLLVEEKVHAAREVDRKLFLKFKETLPSNGSIAFIGRNNFAGFPFELKQLGELNAFIHEWNDAEHEFLDNRLEAKRQELMKLIEEYLGVIGLQTFPTHNPGWNSVPEEWEVEQPDRFEKVVRQLHTLAGKIVDAHQNLIRTARKKLKC